jgi:PAS domain S-box-containing protein
MGILKNPRPVEDFVLYNFDVLNEKERRYLREKERIRVCTDPNWPPYEYFDDGKLMGISKAYLEQFEEILNLKFDYIQTNSWNESVQKATNLECDLLAATVKTQSRAKLFNFSSPYFHAPFVIATKKSRPFITDLNEISNQPIGYVQAYAVPQILKKEYPKLNLVPVESIKDGLRQVRDGKLYGMIDSLATLNFILQKYYQDELKIAGRVNGSYVLRFAARKDEPELASIMEKALGLIDEQTKEVFSNQWSNLQANKSFDYATMWKTLFFVMFVGGFGFWRYHVVKENNKKIQNYLNIIDEYVIMARTDTRGVIQYASQALCRLSGYTKEELVGKTPSILRHPDTSPEVFKQMWLAIRSGKSWHGELKNLRKDKSTYWVDIHISPIFDKRGKIEGFSAFQYDITDKKNLEYLSQTDPLTQIANRFL